MVDIVCTGGGWCAPSAGGGSGWWHVMYPALRQPVTPRHQHRRLPVSGDQRDIICDMSHDIVNRDIHDTNL